MHARNRRRSEHKDGPAVRNSMDDRWLADEDAHAASIVMPHHRGFQNGIVHWSKRSRAF